MKVFIRFLRYLKQKKQCKLLKIANEIRDFYTEKHKGQIQKAAKEVISIGITQIKLKGNTIILVCQSPGMLIGRQGENISNLQKKFPKYILEIEEENIVNQIIPYQPSNFEDMMGITERWSR